MTTFVFSFSALYAFHVAPYSLPAIPSSSCCYFHSSCAAQPPPPSPIPSVSVALSLSDMNLSRGLMAQRNCYSRHTCPSPPLLTRAPPTVDVNEEHNEAAKGDNRGAGRGAPHNVNVQPKGNHQTKMPLSHQPPVGLKSPIRDQERNKPCSPGDSKTPWLEEPSWTVLGTVMDAQWVKRKQEMRGTRPW